MTVDSKKDEAIGEIESYCLENNNPLLTVAFAEGDSYLCVYDNGEWIDNGEWNPGEDTRNLPGFEEWYTLDLRVEKTLVPGPNKNPHYDYIVISCNHMPSSITAGNKVLYEE